MTGCKPQLGTMNLRMQQHRKEIALQRKKRAAQRALITLSTYGKRTEKIRVWIITMALVIILGLSLLNYYGLFTKF